MQTIARRIFGLWSILFVIVVCSAVAADEKMARPGTHKYTTDTRVVGFRRTFRVHVPPSYDGTRAMPMVVAIHGAFSSSRKLERESGFSDLADREGFIVLYPNGIGLFGLLRHWNSGHCCGKARKDEIDDVAYVAALAERVRSRLNVDPQRIYVVGHSNGGMLTHRIAATHGSEFAAYAVVSGTIGGEPNKDEPEWILPRPVEGVPMLLIHGRADENVPYEGGRGPRSVGDASTISVARSVELWTERNQCSSAPRTERSMDDQVLTETWSGCSNDADVVLTTIEPLMHQWPGPRYRETLERGDALHGFDGAQAIWNFFKGRGLH